MYPDTVSTGSIDEMLAHACDLAAAQHPHPNPRVGCVVLSSTGELVGEGAHVAAGTDHAEVIALSAAGERAAGGTLVVTLEPCAHHGSTPPCVDAVLASGVDRVVVGATDPDERASGRGIDVLRSAGVEVEVVASERATEWIDRGYFHHRRTGLPYVTVKMAGTLDGQAAATDGTSQWITSGEARRDVHRLRSRSDAVMVGAGTLRSDDPALDVRLVEARGRQPIPVVVAGRTDLPLTARLYDREPLIFAPGGRSTPAGPSIRAGDGDEVDLGAALADLGERGIIDLLVEGGPRLIRSMLEAELVDRIVWYVGAKLAGGVGTPAVAGDFATLSDAFDLDIVDVARVGPDVRLVANLGKAG